MQIHRYRDIDGTLTDVSANVSRIEWQSTEKAEEGSVGSWVVTVDDPDGELDFNGHRQWFIEEDTSENVDDIVFGGFVAAQDVLPWPGRPLGRVWNLELTDANTFWQRTIMRGTDCNRPAETDVDRIAWLLNTSEAALINDKTTHVQSAGGVAMDAHDYRGEYLGQITADCSMQSGRNWFLWYQKQGDGTRDLIAWYARDTVTAYQSPLYLTNDLADLTLGELDNGTATVYPVAADTKLRRDPSRVYCGCYMNYEAGSTYRHNTTTHTAFAHRDISATQPTVKTTAKAQARADRMLADLDEQDVRITTAVILPASKVTQMRAGMRTEIRGTHWPDGWDDWHYVRVLEASPEPISVGREYRVALELALDTGDASPGPPPDDYEGDALVSIMNSQDYWPDVEGDLAYDQTGDLPAPGWPANPLQGPMSYVDTTAPMRSVQVDADMYVRINAKAHFSGVAGTADVPLHVISSVNGEIGLTTKTHVGFSSWQDFIEVDIRDYHAVAGEVFTVFSIKTGFAAGGFNNSGTGNAYLRVGRGSFVFGSTPWDGP